MSFLMRRGIVSSVIQVPPSTEIMGNMLKYSATKYGTITDAALRLSGSTAFTIAAKVNLDGLGDNTAVMSVWSGAGGWMFYSQSGDVLTFFTNNDTLTWDYSTNTNIVSVVMIMDGSSKEIWVDGTMVASGTGGATLTPPNANLEFGQYQNTTNTRDDSESCGYQIFDVAKDPATLFDSNNNLVYDTSDTDLIFAMSGLSGHDPLTPDTGQTFNTVGGLAADGVGATLATVDS